jgi:hypothetical protein
MAVGLSAVAEKPQYQNSNVKIRMSNEIPMTNVKARPLAGIVAGLDYALSFGFGA